jgi:uncharacterized protein (TIGR02117 family)
MVVAGLLGACAGPVVPTRSGGATVYVIERDWHTDIGVAVDQVDGQLTPFEARFPGVRFLTFGFGERQFLMDRKTDYLTMVGALLPSRSALLVTALRATPEAAFGARNVVALRLSQSDLERIVAAIRQSFESSATAAVTELGEGPYSGSVFFAGQQTYSGLYTCNTWTADTLRAGGLQMPAGGVLFSGQVMGMARWIGAQQAEGP